MLFYILGIPLFTKIITKLVTFHSQEYQFPNVKKSALYSFLIIIAEIIIGLVYILVTKDFIRNIPEYGLLLLQSFFFILLTAIVIVVVLYEKANLQSLGIMKLNLLKSSILGIFYGVIFFLVYHANSKANLTANILTVASLISFIKFIFVGFAEEIIFRGYFQSRLIAWLGTTKGCLITAIIFSFYHLPVNIFFQGMDFQSAFISCASLIPLSLMLGYIMIKTKNIMTVAILHTIIDWTTH
jgi:membrane protease YdiL (CAAX protease family)